jgi:hypothetical protein
MNETVLESESEVSEEENRNATLITDDKVEDENPADASADKSEDADKEAKKDEDSLADKSDGAPESYKDFTFSKDLEFDDELMTEAKSVFKELNLTQEQAQQLVDFESNVKSEEIQRQQKAWDELQDTWKKASETDKEFGGDGLDANLAVAKQGRDAFGDKEFNEMLEVTGVGNHPEMIRFLFKIGKLVSEDKILQGGGSPSGSATQAERLFPDMNK